jgi:hypothetical protein
MIDEELQVRAVEALRVAAALILQEAVETATRRLPEGQLPRLLIADEIASAARDVEVLGQACQVLIRRTGATA